MISSVYVIILNYNHLADLKETIVSFMRQDFAHFKIVVSDNGSTDNSILWLKVAYPDIIVLENKDNLGWAGGNNVGIKYALRNSADYIILANNDISIEDPTLISRMVKDFGKLHEKKFSILGTSVNNFYEKKEVLNTGWIIYPKGEKKDHYFNEYRKNSSIKPEVNFKVVDSTDGCFFMIDSLVFKTIGLLKEELFMYADEIDFSLRAWAQGYASVVNKELTVFHKLGATSVHLSPFSTYYRTRNLLILIKSHNPRLRYFLIYFKDVFKALFRNMTDSKIPLKRKVETQKAIFLGVSHGIKNKTGKRY
jgi:GT2 family glycosyltransferase